MYSYLIIYIPFQSSHHITIPCNPSHHRVSSYHYIVISLCHTTISSHQHIITLTYHHTASYHTIIPPYCHTIIPQDTVHLVNKIPGPNGPVKFQQCQAETLQEGEDQRVLYSDHFSASLLLQGAVRITSPSYVRTVYHVSVIYRFCFVLFCFVFVLFLSWWILLF